MRKIWFLLVLLLLTLVACQNATYEPPPPEAQESSAADQPASSTASSKAFWKKATPYDDVRYLTNPYPSEPYKGDYIFEEDEYDPKDIPFLTYNEGTVFKGSESFAKEIIEYGKNPGLGIRQLHQQGITGKGVNVAMIDANLFLTHPEYAGKIAAYHNTGVDNPEMGSMHGPAMMSNLVGTNMGVAPDVRVYYVARNNGVIYAQTSDQDQDLSNAIHWIIAENEALAADQKIRVISISADPAAWSDTKLYKQACEDAARAGILVIDAASFVGAAYCNYGDDPENVMSYKAGIPLLGPQDLPSQQIAAPAAFRTMAEHYLEDDPSYAYSPIGGVSTAVSYTAGVLALGWQVNPALDKDEMVELLFQTAYVNSDGAKIIYPLAFIEAVNATLK